MASCPVVRLVKGADAAVANVGSPEEADLRARGYAEPGEPKPAPPTFASAPRRNGGGAKARRAETGGGEPA